MIDDNKLKAALSDTENEIADSYIDNPEIENFTIPPEDDQKLRAFVSNLDSRKVTRKSGVKLKTALIVAAILILLLSTTTIAGRQKRIITTETPTVQSNLSKEENGSFNVGEEINDIWVFEDGKVIIQPVKGKTLFTFDPETGATGTEDIPGGTVIKLDNGIAVLNSRNFNFTIYDEELNKITHGQLPFETDEEAEFVISADGENIAYCVRENNLYNVYTESLTHRNRRKICTLGSTDKQGKVAVINQMTSFSDNYITFCGSYVDHIDENGVSVLETCYGVITLNGAVTVKTEDSNRRFEYKGSNIIVADNSPLAPGSTDGTIEYWSAKKGTCESFTFNNGNESRYAMVSENGKYICSQQIESTEIIVRSYAVDSEKLLFEESFPYHPLERYPVDFCEKGNYALLSVGNEIMKISLG